MTDTNIKKIYYQSLDNVSLAEAIDTFKDKLQVANALVYSPKYCQLLKLEEDGQIYNHKGSLLSLNYQTENIFEARIFNEQFELRWLQENDGLGKAVIISEQELDNSKPIEITDKVPQQYLLWGEKAKTQLENGWQRLSTARIGSLNVFVNETHQNMSENQRIYLHTCEYLNVLDDYGNVGVFEERLVKLEVK